MNAMPRNALLALCCWLIVQIPEWSLGQESLAFPVNQEPFAAELKDITSEWQIALTDGDKIRMLAVEDLVSWGAYQDRAERHQILLRDGSLLVADVTSIADGVLRMQSATTRQQEIPLEMVMAVNLLPKLDSAERFNQLQQLRDSDKRDAQVWLANGDQLRGALTRLGNPAERTGDISLQTADVIVEGQPLSLPLESIVAVRFAGSQGNGKETSAKVLIGFDDGSLLYVTRIEKIEGTITLHAESGLAIEPRLARAAPGAAITFVQSQSGKVVYLSDLKPVRASAVPMLDAKYDLRSDRSASGAGLSCRDGTFLKGLGMHSASNVVYTIGNASYRRFAAEVAIDRSSGDGGSVVFRVYLLAADNQWIPSFTSDIIRGGRAPTPIALELGEAKAIALAVEQSERGDVLDRANWLNARFEK